MTTKVNETRERYPWAYCRQNRYETDQPAAVIVLDDHGIITATTRPDGRPGRGDREVWTVDPAANSAPGEKVNELLHELAGIIDTDRDPYGEKAERAVYDFPVDVLNTCPQVFTSPAELAETQAYAGAVKATSTDAEVLAAATWHGYEGSDQVILFTQAEEVEYLTAERDRLAQEVSCGE